MFLQSSAVLHITNNEYCPELVPVPLPRGSWCP